VILSNYLSQLKNPVESVRCGYTLALGMMPKGIMMGHFDRVLAHLMEASKIKEQEVKCVEARRDAIKAITRLDVCMCVGDREKHKSSLHHLDESTLD